MPKYFITGTDTGIGKTYVTCHLINAWQQQNKKVIAIKPVASGCEMTTDGLRNEDALALQKSMNIKLPYSIINPICFAPPIAPSIAAQQTNQALSVEDLLQACESAFAMPADIYLIEGVGGWFVPLNKTQSMSDFVKQIDADVIMVVGIRLGCINHALLTYQALQLSGLKIRGWIANCIDPNVLVVDEILQTLNEWLPIECLEVVPFNG